MTWKFSKHKSLKKLLDDELIAKYKQSGDAIYVGELFKRYTHHVFLVCKKYLKEDTRSEDETMVIFEKLLEKLLEHEVYNFKSWLGTMTRNHCLTLLQKEKTTNKNLANYLDAENPFVEIDFDNGLSETELNLQYLETALENLSEEQRQCVYLFYIECKSYQEVVTITGYELKKVKSYIQNGKRNLKIFLSEKINEAI